MDGRIIDLFFSPTHSSEKTGGYVCGELARILGMETERINFTQPAIRSQPLTMRPDDILVFSFPVYGGRVPGPVAEALASLNGNGCAAVVTGVYGNRAFDDALLEAADLLASRGCRVVAAIGAIAQHTYDEHIAHGRPDAEDRLHLEEFAGQIATKLSRHDFSTPQVPGNRPYREAPTPPPLLPQTSDQCDFCGICAAGCPMGIIDPEDEHKVSGACLICMACVKFCPRDAKSFSGQFLAAVRERLAKAASGRKEPQLFI